MPTTMNNGDLMRSHKQFYMVFTRANFMLKRKQVKHALRLYDQALELSPHHATCLQQRAQCYLELGRYEEALNDAQCAMALSSNYCTGLLQKGEALLRLGRCHNALIAFTVGACLQPASWEFRRGAERSRDLVVYCSQETGQQANVEQVLDELQGKAQKILCQVLKQREIRKQDEHERRTVKTLPIVKHRDCSDSVQLNAFYKNFTNRMLAKNKKEKTPLEHCLWNKRIDYHTIFRSKKKRLFPHLKPCSRVTVPCEICAEYALIIKKITESKETMKERKVRELCRMIRRLFGQMGEAHEQFDYTRAIHLGISAIDFIKSYNVDLIPQKDLNLSIAYEMLAEVSKSAGLYQQALDWLKIDMDHCKNVTSLKEHVATVYQSVGRTHARFGELNKAISSWSCVENWTSSSRVRAATYLLLASALLKQRCLDQSEKYARLCVDQCKDEDEDKDTTHQAGTIINFITKYRAIEQEGELTDDDKSQRQNSNSDEHKPPQLASLAKI